MNIVFTRPEYLWLLLSLPLLVFIHILSLKFIKRKALRFANFEAIEKITGKTVLSRNIILLFFRLFIVLLFVFSASGTVLWYMGYASDFDFVLSIDASSSMLADDYNPNRLEVAKDAAIIFIDSLGAKTNLAVMTFAGVTYLKYPLKNIDRGVKSAIKEIGIEHAGGTAIGGAIQEGTNRLMEANQARVIIILTDGQNNVGIDIDEAIYYANEYGVTVHTIGVATQEGGTLEGLSFISKLDEESLKHISEETGGQYFHVGNREEMTEAFQDIARSRKQKLSWHMGFFLMILALILLFFEWILQNTKYRTIP